MEAMRPCRDLRQGVAHSVCGRRIICDHFSTCDKGYPISGAEAARCRSWLALDSCWISSDPHFQELYRRELTDAGFFQQSGSALPTYGTGRSPSAPLSSAGREGC